MPDPQPAAARDADLSALVERYHCENPDTYNGITTRRAQLDELARLATQARDDRDRLAAQLTAIQHEAMSVRTINADGSHADYTDLDEALVRIIGKARAVLAPHAGGGEGSTS
jgi:hypothetical protein